MRISICFLLFTVFLASCEEKKSFADLKAEAKSWINHDGFRYNQKIFFSNYTDGQNLYLYGPRFFSILNKKRNVTSYLMFLTTYPYGKKIPINNFITPGLATDTSFFLFQTSDMGQSALFLELKNYLSNLTYVPKSNFYDTKNIMAINSRNQLLLPVRNNLYQDKLILFDLDYSMPVKVVKSKIIDLPYTISDRGVYFIESIKEDFIVSSTSSTYQIKPDGTYSKIYNQPTVQLFTYKDKIYCVSFYERMFVSSNDGLTWNEFTNVPPEWGAGIMLQIGDSLVFNSLSRFFTVKLKDSGEFYLRELKNDGLELEQVTTITDFNDSIFATTYSGVYYKSKKDFFESKPKK